MSVPKPFEDVLVSTTTVYDFSASIVRPENFELTILVKSESLPL